VPAELLLDVCLGVDRCAERAHRDLEFAVAECADCNHRRRTKPLDDLQIARFRKVVLVYHRNERSGSSKHCLVSVTIIETTGSSIPLP
jgi:hypothetical protein